MSLIKVDTAKVASLNAKERIAELKRKLAETDYVTLPDYDKDKPEVIEQRAEWRDEIRQLEPMITSED